MTAAFVNETDTWPSPGPFPLHLEEFDGEISIIPGVDGCEVPIFGPRTDEGTLVICWQLASIDQARRVGRTLALAFAKVRAIEAEPAVEPDDGHEHRFEEFRLSRTIKKHRICTLCDVREEAT